MMASKMECLVLEMKLFHIEQRGLSLLVFKTQARPEVVYLSTKPVQVQNELIDHTGLPTKEARPGNELLLFLYVNITVQLHTFCDITYCQNRLVCLD